MELPNIKWIISVMFLSTTNSLQHAGKCGTAVVVISSTGFRKNYTQIARLGFEGHGRSIRSLLLSSRRA